MDTASVAYAELSTLVQHLQGRLALQTEETAIMTARNEELRAANAQLEEARVALKSALDHAHEERLHLRQEQESLRNQLGSAVGRAHTLESELQLVDTQIFHLQQIGQLVLSGGSSLLSEPTPSFSLSPYPPEEGIRPGSSPVQISKHPDNDHTQQIRPPLQLNRTHSVPSRSDMPYTNGDKPRVHTLSSPKSTPSEHAASQYVDSPDLRNGKQYPPPPHSPFSSYRGEDTQTQTQRRPYDSSPSKHTLPLDNTVPLENLSLVHDPHFSFGAGTDKHLLQHNPSDEHSVLNNNSPLYNLQSSSKEPPNISAELQLPNTYNNHYPLSLPYANSLYNTESGPGPGPIPNDASTLQHPPPYNNTAATRRHSLSNETQHSASASSLSNSIQNPSSLPKDPSVPIPTPSNPIQNSLSALQNPSSVLYSQSGIQHAYEKLPYDSADHE